MFCSYMFCFDYRYTKARITLGGGTNRHCFYGLQPDSEYKISVYTKLQEMEGPSVSVTGKTRKSKAFSLDLCIREQTVF